MFILDCTLRDGGYYNDWDFSLETVQDYLYAVDAAEVNIVELGLRSLKNQGFKGPCAFTSDDFLRNLDIPDRLEVAVMVNAAELVGLDDMNAALTVLFPEPESKSPVNVVRIACHIHEFSEALLACSWLKERGFTVGFNLMQIADCPQQEVENLGAEASLHSPDVLYFADSMGSMTPDDTTRIISWLREHWKGALGIHTHDSMGLAIQNTLRAADEGVTWLDATITGMGRGPGNGKMEQLVIEIAERKGNTVNLVPMMSLIRRFFLPMQQKCGWGTNTYYYLAGKYGIHPTYIQEMLGDSRYSEEDVLAAIDHLRVEGRKKFSLNTLDAARCFYKGVAKGDWLPSSVMGGKDVLILGTGPGISKHRWALENYIKQNKPIVIALNTQSAVDASLINLRVACHPVRLLADCETHLRLPQPLITPASMLPEDVALSLSGKKLLDFGLMVEPDKFEFNETGCTLPSSLVIAYALAVATSGKAKQIFMAGFDGYSSDDPRATEMQNLLDIYVGNERSIPLVAVTPTRYAVNTKSIYAM